MSEYEVEKYVEESWQVLLNRAITAYIAQATFTPPSDIILGLDKKHTAETPQRVVAAYAEYVSGYLEDPHKVLEKSFDDSSAADEMVHQFDIPIVSFCAHHIAPIIGAAHFAYIPKDRVLGLSKIPRFIDILSRRLQIQEKLCREIVDIFPIKDCAVEIVAYHCCMLTRGVRTHPVKTVTSALRGVFKNDPTTKAEFFGRRQELKLL